MGLDLTDKCELEVVLDQGRTVQSSRADTADSTNGCRQESLANCEVHWEESKAEKDGCRGRGGVHQWCRNHVT